MADRKSFFGAFALSSATVFKLALQLIVLPILARLLGPSAYGVVAVALPFILFANMLCDGGMAAALARQPQVSRRLESTVFWLTAGASTLLALAMSGGAVFIARGFGQPALAPVLIALTPVLILSATLSVANSRVTRSQRFSIFAIGEVCASVVAAAAAIFAALRGAGAWSLVIQQLVYWTTKAVWLFPASGFRPTLEFNLKEAVPHLKYGVNMVGASLSDFGTKNIPVMLIAGAFGSAGAGRFGLANQLARIPELVVAGPLYLPVFTAAARAQADGAELAPMVNRLLRVCLTGLAPLFVGWILVADLATHAILGPKWIGTEVLMQLIAPGSLAMCMILMLAAVLQGIGRSDTQFRLSLGLVACTALGALVGSRISEPAAVAGVTAASFVMLPIYVATLSRRLSSSPARLLAGCLAPLVATAVMAGAVLGVRHLGAHLPGLVQLAISIAAGAVAYAVALLAISGRRLQEDLKAVLPARRAGLTAAGP
jgi:PST family polysaccharide transporter